MPLTFDTGIKNQFEMLPELGAVFAGEREAEASRMRGLETLFQEAQNQYQNLQNDRYSQMTPLEVQGKGLSNRATDLQNLFDSITLPSRIIEQNTKADQAVFDLGQKRTEEQFNPIANRAKMQGEKVKLHSLLVEAVQKGDMKSAETLRGYIEFLDEELRREILKEQEKGKQSRLTEETKGRIETKNADKKEAAEKKARNLLYLQTMKGTDSNQLAYYTQVLMSGKEIDTDGSIIDLTPERRKMYEFLREERRVVVERQTGQRGPTFDPNQIKGSPYKEPPSIPGLPFNTGGADGDWEDVK